MFTRVVTITGARDVDAGIDFLRETVAPLLHQQKGFRGVTGSVDRANGVLGVLSLWESAADRDAAESALGKARSEAQKITGGTASLEYFEETHLEMGKPPKVGSKLLLRRLSMSPSRIEDNLAYFKREIVPQIKAGKGFLGLRQMVNRETGDTIVGTVWSDQASLEAAARDAEARQAASADRVTFGEQSRREIVFVDLV